MVDPEVRRGILTMAGETSGLEGTHPTELGVWREYGAGEGTEKENRAPDSLGLEVTALG